MKLAEKLIQSVNEKNDRSAFLSSLMSKLSGDLGKEVISSYALKDYDRFKASFGKIYDKLLKDTVKNK